MSRNLTRTAGSPWAPLDQANLTLRQAAHLFRRAAFGATIAELEQAARSAPGELVDRLLDAVLDEELERQSQAMKGVVQTGDLAQQLPAWWLYRLMHTANQVREKASLFWHGHFATSAAKVRSAPMSLAQNEVFRRGALGNFADLVVGISRDPAMLIYLDSATNRRNAPNENYARELLELFCLGIGNYTERDIRELARAFTGWEIQNGRFAFNSFQHDPTPKSLLGKDNIESGEQAIEWILQQPAAARFIAGKLYRFYVSDLGAEPAVIDSLAETLRENKFEIRPALRQIFLSRLFYEDATQRARIRSPVELAIGLLRGLGATSSPVRLAGQLANLGQSLFFPPNVKGWDGGKSWINSATLIGRINLVAELIDHTETRFATAKKDLDEFWRVSDAASAVDRVESVWLAVPLSPQQREQWSQVVARTCRPRESFVLTALKAASTLAEFQLG